jgi:hypothetical protein
MRLGQVAGFVMRRLTARHCCQEDTYLSTVLVRFSSQSLHMRMLFGGGVEVLQPPPIKVRFEVSTAVTMKNAVFWDVTPRGCVACVG